MRSGIPLVVLAIVLALLYARRRSVGLRVEYRCGRCGQSFPLKPMMAVLAPHMGGRKLARCPSCAARTWTTPVPMG